MSFQNANTEANRNIREMEAEENQQQNKHNIERNFNVPDGSNLCELYN